MIPIKKNELLERIANFLIVNITNFDNLGLYHGKMGIALFFAHYSRYTQKKLYNDFALEIIANIYQDIHSDYPISFANGVCGIGWGIEYLVQNKFVEGDTQEVLEDIDVRIMEINPLRIKDISLEKGLLGIGYYVAYHIKSIKSNKSVIDSDYLLNLSVAFEKKNSMIMRGNMGQLANQVLLFFKSTISTIGIQNDLSFLDLLIAEIKNTDEINWLQTPLGLDGGIAGLGLKLMV